MQKNRTGLIVRSNWGWSLYVEEAKPENLVASADDPQDLVENAYDYDLSPQVIA